MNNQKIAPGLLRFISMLFSNIPKRDEQKLAPGFIGFVSMPF